MTSFFSGKSCVFIAGAADPQAFPAPQYPEIAFVGRSNVGKSSLINALLDRQALARVSKTPGRTRQINFFCLDDALYLVDLPGYGYAQVSHKMRVDWENLMETYLRDRPTLQQVYLLIDSRHALKPIDEMMMDFLDAARVSYQLVLTKRDKISPTLLAERANAFQQIALTRKTALPAVITTSASQKEGLESLRERIALLIKE